MSRSVTIASSRSPSTIGSEPTSSSRIRRAASTIGVDAEIVFGDVVIASLTVL
jgi:hypothetical protein